MLQNGSYRKLTERLSARLSNHMSLALAMLKRANWDVYTEPTGGMFVWAKPPAAITPERLSELADDWKVTLSPGHLFFADHQPTPWRRLNVAYMQDPRAKGFIEG
ncbi:MAG: PLP-dependent aminotransferase family protein, partial [Halomonas venusta]|nr:PLP-dependent aminotransferase family protein [Halomonas venusta]